MTESVRSRIRGWLEEEGWGIAERDNPASLWLLVATDPAGRRLIVGRARRPESLIRIEAAVDLAPAHASRFASLPPGGREELLWGLRFRLLQMGVDFQGLADPLQRVSVSQRVYLDGLTRDRFMQRLAVTKNALISIVWSIGRALGELSPDDDAETPVH